jgi:benzoyl-CoA reductase/2-hydroxyglutaryl-CoA dehydratase subunit BcrC/BadD/HgdB
MGFNVKEQASDKAFANVMKFENEIESIKKDILKESSGNVTKEQLESVLELLEKERTTWSYIFSLIEKDNTL